MTAADVLRAIRARWLLFAVCCIVPLAAAIQVARTSAPVYTSTASSSSLRRDPPRAQIPTRTPFPRPSSPRNRPRRMHRW